MRLVAPARTVERMFRSITRPQLVVDVCVAAAFLLLFSWEFWAVGLIGGLVTVAMAASLAVRRLSPGLALVIAWAGAIFLMLMGQNPSPSNIAICGVLYATAAYGNSLVRWLGFASIFVGAVSASTYLAFVPIGFEVRIGGSFSELTKVILGVTVLTAVGVFGFGLSWTAGLLMRSRMIAAAARAAQQAAELERLRMQQFAAVESERARIGRELHDIVGHSLAVVIAQADGARYLNRGGIPDASDAVDDALGTISTTARAALGDVRGLLGALRTSAIEAPQPDLAQLDALLVQFRAAGLTIELDRSGDESALGAAGQLSVFRIVQESLTNVLRHGDKARPVTVMLESGSRETRIRIVSALRAGAVMGPRGYGITGMTERASLAGGALSAAAASGLFVVKGSIPATKVAERKAAERGLEAGATGAADDPDVSDVPAGGARADATRVGTPGASDSGPTLPAAAR
jgi:signal transduction histidine kinase